MLTSDDRFVRYHLPVLVWMLVIFVSSSIPSEEFPRVEFWGWAKLVHLVYFSMFCFLMQRALLHQRRFPALARHAALAALLATVLYGASDEFHQLLTPGRHGMVADVMIDTLGALLFLGGAFLYRKMRPSGIRSGQRATLPAPERPGKR